jgi:putative ABC transport system permease protein
MLFKENIKMSWQNVIHHKMRSFLTILGIVIGIASVITLITVVQGVSDSVVSTVSNMGANKISVQISGTPLKNGLTEKDLMDIKDIDNVNGISPKVNAKLAVLYKGEIYESSIVQGRNQVYFNNTEDLLASGRGINILDCEGNTKVCLIGQDIKNELFPMENPEGKELVIKGIRYTVIGTLHESNGFSMDSNDNAIIMPYSSSMKLLDTRTVKSLDIYIENGDKAETTSMKIEQSIDNMFNNDDKGYKVTNMQTILDKVDEMTGMLSMMLISIASISLLVGGIGIMNMMLVSVTERTAEIGLRKALGAEPKRIEQQFLSESIFLSVFGGIIGMLLGIIMSFMISMAIGSTFTLSVSTILIAVGFSTLIGMVFGYAPARKASKLNPIDALRSI